MSSLLLDWARTNCWVNNRVAGDLKCSYDEERAYRPFLQTTYIQHQSVITVVPFMMTWQITIYDNTMCFASFGSEGKRKHFTAGCTVSCHDDKLRCNQWQFCQNDEILVHDVIKWKHFPRSWPFVQGIHRSPVNSTHKGQWRRALMFSWSE